MKRQQSPIEVVMVTLLVVVLVAIAVPNFIDFRSEAKDVSTRNALSSLRTAISIGVAAIQLKEDPSAGTPRFPTLTELQNNGFGSAHPQLVGTNLLDPTVGVPPNPWSVDAENPKALLDCAGLDKSTVLTREGQQDFGWCYNADRGQIWANSARNGAGAGATENTF